MIATIFFTIPYAHVVSILFFTIELRWILKILEDSKYLMPSASWYYSETEVMQYL